MIENNVKYYPERSKEYNANIDELYLKVMVQKVDILKHMEVINKRMREFAIKDSTDDKIKAYDIGVKNTMSALEALITNEKLEGDRLIYQKYGEHSNGIRFMTLPDVLEELKENKQLQLAKEFPNDGKNRDVFGNIVEQKNNGDSLCQT